MKKILLTLALVATICSGFAQEINWLTNLKEASDLSIKEKKPVMLFFTGSDWCGWCIRLQNEVFRKPEFIKWANQNVIAVELDFPRSKPQDAETKNQNQQLGQMLGVQGYPTCWFVTPVIEGGQIKLNPLGSQGYMAGGPNAWTAAVDVFLNKEKGAALAPVAPPAKPTPPVKKPVIKKKVVTKKKK